MASSPPPNNNNNNNNNEGAINPAKVIGLEGRSDNRRAQGNSNGNIVGNQNGGTMDVFGNDTNMQMIMLIIFLIQMINMALRPPCTC